MSLYTSVLKRVLVAADLSGPSDHAVGRALQLAAAHGAELDIVNIVEEGLPPEAEAERKASNAGALREKLTASPFADQVSVTIDVVVGNADTDILERAVMTNANCIVLGLHERLLPENLPIEGTLAETVIKGSSVPVLLVHNAPREAYQTVVVGVDLSPLSRAAIEAAVLIAPKSTLHLVHAYETAETYDPLHGLESFVAGEQEVFDRAAAQANLAEIAVTMAAEPGDPREVLKSEVEARGADLLVLGTHGRTGIARTLLGSVATDLINDRLCDVLVFRLEE